MRKCDVQFNRKHGSRGTVHTSLKKRLSNKERCGSLRIRGYDKGNAIVEPGSAIDLRRAVPAVSIFQDLEISPSNTACANGAGKSPTRGREQGK